MQEPVLANLLGYPVLVKTPEGNHLSVRGGAAVAGPGFERYIENRTLTRVATDFPGTVVYETPVAVISVAPTLVDPEVPLSAPDPTVDLLPGSGESVLDDVSAQLLPPEPAKTEAEAAKEREAIWARKYTGDHLTIPAVTSLQTMSKSELVYLLGKLGMRTDGSRSQCSSRLQPIAGKSVPVKK